MVEPTGFHSALLEAVPADGCNIRRLYRALCIACTAAFRVKLSFQWQLSELGELPLVAGWVRSPKAASEHSCSQNLGLADRPLSGNRFGRFGSGARIRRTRKQPVTVMQAPTAAYRLTADRYRVIGQWRQRPNSRHRWIPLNLRSSRRKATLLSPPRFTF